jgi:hypothetical protein
MANAATPEQVDEVRRLREQINQELRSMIKADMKNKVRDTIEGMLAKNANAEEIVSALDNAGYFVGDEPMGEAPPEQPAPGMPPAMPPDMPPEMASKQDQYMQAAQRNM